MNDLSIKKLKQMYEKKVVSPIEITKHFLHKIEIHQDMNAYISVTAEMALAQAEIAEHKIMKKLPLGNLEGIPIGIKDNIHTTFIPTTSGSKVDKDFIPKQNADVVDQLLDQSAIHLGKQNMHEFAFGITSNNPHYGPVKNPWNKKISAAGSSGGSAVSVAMQLSLASIGTDTGGSIRIPAAASGVVGLKPTYQLLSGKGITNISWTLDHIGPIAKDVTDTALLMDVLSNEEKYMASLNNDIRGLRIGIAKNYFCENIDPRISEKFHETILKLEALGAVIIEIDVPCERSTLDNNFIIAKSEANFIHEEKLNQYERLYGEDVKAILTADKTTSLQYIQSLQNIKNTSYLFRSIFNQIDVLATPTAAVIPQLIGKNTVYMKGEEKDLFTETTSYGAIFNLTGQPAISIPTGEFVDQIPVGVQFVGNHFEETKLLHVSYAYEQAYLQAFYKKREYLGGRNNDI